MAKDPEVIACVDKLYRMTQLDKLAPTKRDKESGKEKAVKPEKRVAAMKTLQTSIEIAKVYFCPESGP